MANSLFVPSSVLVVSFYSSLEFRSIPDDRSSMFTTHMRYESDAMFGSEITTSRKKRRKNSRIFTTGGDKTNLKEKTIKFDGDSKIIAAIVLKLKFDHCLRIVQLYARTLSSCRENKVQKWYAINGNIEILRESFAREA